jgi:hypothetical protein
VSASYVSWVNEKPPDTAFSIPRTGDGIPKARHPTSTEGPWVKPLTCDDELALRSAPGKLLTQDEGGSNAGSQVDRSGIQGREHLFGFPPDSTDGALGWDRRSARRDRGVGLR